jgi:hypothetical protein
MLSNKYERLERPRIRYDEFKEEGASPLHLLYEGRYMRVPQGFGYDNRDLTYGNEHPQQAEQDFETHRKEIRQNAKEIQNLSLQNSGQKRITRHPAVEPDSFIEDPEFKYVQFNDDKDQRNFNPERYRSK